MAFDYIFDYSNLRGEIKKKYHNNTEFANEIGINKSTLSRKLNDGKPFGNDEIVAILDVLKLPQSDVNSLFFCIKICEN